MLELYGFHFCIQNLTVLCKQIILAFRFPLINSSLWIKKAYNQLDLLQKKHLPD